MFLKPAISKLLKKEIEIMITAFKTPAIMRSIQSVALDQSKKVIFGSIDGYETVLYYDSNIEIIKMTCNCRSNDKYCAHKAHFLLHLKKMEEENAFSKVTSNMDVASITSTNSDNIVKLKIQSLISDFKIPGSKEIVSKLTTTDTDMIQQRIKAVLKYGYPGAREYSVFLIEKDWIEVNIAAITYSGNISLAKFIFKKVNSDIIIVPSYSPQSKINVIPENEVAYLFNEEAWLNILLKSGKYFYQEVVDTFSEKSKVSGTDIKLFFKLQFTGKGNEIALTKSVANYLRSIDIKSQLNLTSLKSENRVPLVGDILKDISKKDYQMANVIFWISEKVKAKRYSYLGQAKQNKLLNKLSSGFKLAESPRYLDDTQLHFYNALKLLEQEVSNVSIRKTQIAKLLYDQKETASTLYHVLDTGGGYKRIDEYSINDVFPISFSEDDLQIHIEIVDLTDKYGMLKYFTIGDQKYIFYYTGKEPEIDYYHEQLLKKKGKSNPYKSFLLDLPYHPEHLSTTNNYGDNYNSYYDDDEDDDYDEDDEYDDDVDEYDEDENDYEDDKGINESTSFDSKINEYLNTCFDIFKDQKDIYFINEKHFEMRVGFCVFNNQGYIYENPATQHIHKNLPTFRVFDKNIENIDAILQECHGIVDVILPDSLHIEVVQLDMPKYELYLSESEDFIIFKPVIKYQDNIGLILPLTTYSIYQSEDTSFKRYDILQGDAESFTDFLEDAHHDFRTANRQYGQYFLHINTLMDNMWFLEFFDQCRQRNITIFGQENLSKFKFNQNKANIKVGISSGIDWFDVNVDIKYGKHKVQLKSWVDAVKNNQKFIQLSDGSLGLLPEEWIEKLKTLSKISKKDGDHLVVSKYNFGLLDSQFDDAMDTKLRKEISKKIKHLQDFDQSKKYKLPSSVKAELRPYQMEGYQWLKSLEELNFGGCLADDMGLGKTLQVLSLLADLAERKAGTSLVIVPKSLLFNWDAEIKKFCITLRHYIHHGQGRYQSAEDFIAYDLIITTYDTATSDIEWLKDVKFHYIILDESQAIKNPVSQRYKAMRLLQAHNRLVMTGTPIENNTFDLFAQFSFINPGIFGSAGNFKEEFAVPIDKNKDQPTALLLQKMVKPFLLRRTKSQVATDLPERIENIIYCEMGPTQKSYYEAMKNEIRNDLLAADSEKNFGQSKLKIIEGLLRLRQICNSPELIHPTINKDKSISVKTDTLLDIIENELGGHNALIFSQFTSMLSLIRKELDERHIKYAYLDGSTQNRKAAVMEFEDNDDIKLFLISLKAGNTGLNLTKADYVYIVDPWWNPAVEAQAIDRTHRIGQTKNVFAYKLVCKDTIEEKIIELQANKKSLSDSIISTEENAFSTLSKDEILALFK